MIWILLAAGLVVGVTIYDISQRKHAILRNFPAIGHFRYLLESVGPELRQYIVTDNLQLSHACGVAHPSLVTLDSFDILDPGLGARSAREVFGYRPEDGIKSPIERAEIATLMEHSALSSFDLVMDQ